MEKLSEKSDRDEARPRKRSDRGRFLPIRLNASSYRSAYRVVVVVVVFLTFTFQLMDKLWSQVSSLPPGTCLQISSRIGFSLSLIHI